MNTYGVTEVKHVPDNLLEEVINEAKKAHENGELICIRLDNGEYDDGTETMIYSIHRNSPSWVEHYYRSGGMWEYCDPSNFITKGE